jgi:hypothetical protein
MACFSPLKGWRSKTLNPSGKRGVVFNRKDGFADLPVELPCGQCIGCRLERSRQWAIRCIHEAQMHEENCFITLTYNDEHLPEDRSVDVRDFQLFMKRLRKRYAQKIRFFHCGEYGENTQRPHYHALIFGHDFSDRQLYSVRDDVRLDTSRELERLWGKGFCTVGDVTFESAAYVARYIVKKINGEAAKSHYEYTDTHGVIHARRPEYITMSRRPGIGRSWLDRYGSDVWNHDYVVIRGRKMRPPKFYDGVQELLDENQRRKTRGERVRNAKKHSENNTPDRLKVREVVQNERLKMLPRNVE